VGGEGERKDLSGTPPVAQEDEGVTSSPNADLQVAPSRGCGQEPGPVSSFQNAKNISITGGHFISTSGTINVNRELSCPVLNLVLILTDTGAGPVVVQENRVRAQPC